MTKSSKLKNVEAVNKMLRGEHRTQTRTVIGYRDLDKIRETAIVRNVGDVWTETDSAGNVYIWEQRDGYRVKRREHSDIFQAVRDELRQFKNCRKDVCTCVNPSNLDHKFRMTHGMCFDCVTEEETRLKLSGKFNEYAAARIYENVKAFFRDRDAELEAMKRSVRSGYNFALEAGDLENWSTDSPESIISRIEADYTAYRDAMLDYYNPNKDTVENATS